MTLKRLIVLFVTISVTFSIVNCEDDVKFNRSECSRVSIDKETVEAPFNRTKWPWLAALFLSKNLKFHCSGSLVSEYFVITAAHCLQNKKQSNEESKKPQDLIVYLGKYNLTDDTEDHVVTAIPEEFYIHSDWKPSDSQFDADIALIKLSAEVSFSSYVQPVCLWTWDVIPKQNDFGFIVGWGANASQMHGEHSNFSRELKVHLNPISNCTDDSEMGKVISPRGLCVASNDIGPCSGDSGGGFYTAIGNKWFLRGITSASLIDCYMSCDTRNPSVSTNVQKFIVWIEKILGENQRRAEP